MPRNKVNISLEVTGINELLKTLKQIGNPKKQRAILRPALNYAVTPLNKAVKAKAPKETGALKKSISKKAFTVDDVVGIVIGARRGKQFTVGEGKDKRNPSAYYHLVEFGHIARDGSFVQPQPSLRPAIDSTAGEVKSRLIAKLRERLEKEAEKIAAKLKGTKN